MAQVSDDRRLALLRAALGFPPAPAACARAAAAAPLARHLDGLRLIVGGVERQGLRFSLSHIADPDGGQRS